MRSAAKMMAGNQEDYVDNKEVRTLTLTTKDGIIYQYGGGRMFKPGSYDRYTPFKLHPDADFLNYGLADGIGSSFV